MSLLMARTILAVSTSLRKASQHKDYARRRPVASSLPPSLALPIAYVLYSVEAKAQTWRLSS